MGPSRASLNSGAKPASQVSRASLRPRTDRKRFSGGHAKAEHTRNKTWVLVCRVVLAVFCFLIFACSVTVLGLTVQFYIQTQALYDNEPVTVEGMDVAAYSVFNVPIYCLMGLSIIVTLANLCGCIGGFTHDGYLLMYFALIMLALIIALIVGVALTVVYIDEVKPELVKALSNFFVEFYGSNNKIAKAFDELIDEAQRAGCCGYLDPKYYNITPNMPAYLTILFFLEDTQYGARQNHKCDSDDHCPIPHAVPGACCRSKGCSTELEYSHRLQWDAKKEKEWSSKIYINTCHGEAVDRLMKSRSTAVIAVVSVTLFLMLAAAVMAIVLKCVGDEEGD